MTLPTPLELKKLLIGMGFEVYRTMGTKVLLAERVRDNLLMDGNVAVCTGELLELRFITRAQQGDFPTETEGQLLDRARFCGVTAIERGYREVGIAAVAIHDPGDHSKTLDTWYEVTFSRHVHSVEEMIDDVRFALGLDKIA